MNTFLIINVPYVLSEINVSAIIVISELLIINVLFCVYMCASVCMYLYYQFINAYFNIRAAIKIT